MFRASCPHVAQEARPWGVWEGRPGHFVQGSCAVRVIQSCFRGIEYQFGSNKDTDNQPSSYTLSNKPNDQQGSKARKRKKTYTQPGNPTNTPWQGHAGVASIVLAAAMARQQSCARLQAFASTATIVHACTMPTESGRGMHPCLRTSLAAMHPNK